MNKKNTAVLFSTVTLFCVALILTSCKENQEKENMTSSNILLEEWTGPYGGVPSFDKMELKDLKSALEIGMKINLEDIDAITKNSEEPTFENTIAEMEKAGEELDRVFNYYGLWSANLYSH